MNLLFITPGKLPLPPVKGGAVENLINILIEKNEEVKNDKYIIYSIWDKEAEEKTKSKHYKNVEIHYININKRLVKIERAIRFLINRIPGVYIGNPYIARVRKKIEKEKFDYIIIENAPEFGLKLKKYKDKLILHLHNDALNKNTKLHNRIVKTYNKIFVISDFLGDNVNEITNNNRVMTLHNGIEFNNFKDLNRDEKVKVRYNYNIKEDEIVIMYSGRLVPEKGIMELEKAVIKLISNFKVKLIIVGGNGYSSNIETKYVKKLKEIAKPYKNNIIFMGFIDYQEINKIYSIADIGVVPSLCNDAFNLTTVEFMIKGIPIVISDKGAMKEIINDKCGLIAHVNDKFVQNLYLQIKELVQNKELRRIMGVESKKRAMNFSSDNYYNNFIKLLRKKEK